MRFKEGHYYLHKPTKTEKGLFVFKVIKLGNSKYSIDNVFYQLISGTEYTSPGVEFNTTSVFAKDCEEISEEEALAWMI